MGKCGTYREILRSLDEWEPYLLEHSGLPGPRGNIELGQAVADEGSESLFLRLLAYGPEVAPVGTAEEFLAFCGVVGLGRLLAGGRMDLLAVIRGCASDPRWRVREGVAMALQRLGDADMGALLDAMADWAGGNPYEQRAAAAALCEPRLLKVPAHAPSVFDILNEITVSVARVADRKSEGFQALRKGLGYCWSVAVAAYPEAGRPHFERWCASADPDVRWVMRENLRKNRLRRLDAGWVAACEARMG